MKLVTRLFSLAALLATLAAAPAAHAQLTFSLTPASQAGNPGDTLHFTGMLSNTSTTDTVSLAGGDTVNFNAPGLTLDDTPFFNNAPATLQTAGSVDGNNNSTDSFTGDFFDVKIANDGTAVPGTFFGTFTVNATDNATGADASVSQDFSVTVDPSPVPEASTTVSFGLLLLLGLGGVVIAKKRRQSA